jgi:hypothetical protein
MTTNELAAGYHRKCVDRLAALDVLHARHAHSDVVRESQEVVELALKGMLRWAGVDPPKIHDVGDLLLEFAGRFEFSFYGDIDFIPTDEYDADDADTAIGQARLAAACLGRLLGGSGPA